MRKRQITRRGFLKETGASLIVAGVAEKAVTPAPSRTIGGGAGFTPEGGLTKVSENLYFLRDTCNVYVLKDGDRALLIDFGSGHILDLLGQVGVSKVDGILHTHHHRDQSQGDGQAVLQRIPIHVPAHEQHLFEDAENFWRNRRVFHLYYVRNDFFTLTHNIPVAGVLRDYDTFRWGTYEFLIFPTPGHTLGAISLVGLVDGKKVAFTGDLIHSPGKVVNLYELQYGYGSSDGVDVAIFSLGKLRELGLELVCPSHGEPLANPENGITELAEKLKAWWKTYSPGNSLSNNLTIEGAPFAVTPHLICSSQACSTTYSIISDSGKALFVDYGSASWNVFKSFLDATSTTERIRFVEHTIPELQARFGLKSIDIAMPSHLHDDHVNGFPYLVRHFGTRIWCYENMVDVLQNPRGYNLGCILGEPIQVDRSFRHGERFEWEEFEFTVYHFPGHTEYQMLLLVDIDGAKIAFTGDAFEPARVGQSLELHHDLIFRNWVESDSHLKSIRTILEHQPNIVAPAHGKPFVCNKTDLEGLQDRLVKQQEYFRSVIADPDCDFGLNPSWVRLYPYQLQARVGTNAEIELRVRNYRSRPMRLEATLILPAGWKASPEVVSLTVPPKGDGREDFTVTIPETWGQSKPRVALAADVRADGQYLGEITEGVVDLTFPK